MLKKICKDMLTHLKYTHWLHWRRQERRTEDGKEEGKRDREDEDEREGESSDSEKGVGASANENGWEGERKRLQPAFH